ncbi:hypothetical protein QQ045_009771 [Rhodiola kirilowii]
MEEEIIKSKSAWSSSRSTYCTIMVPAEFSRSEKEIVSMEADADVDIVLVAELLVQLNDEHSNNGDGGCGGDDGTSRQVSFPDNEVASTSTMNNVLERSKGRRRRRQRFRSVDEVYAKTKPLNNVRVNNTVLDFGSKRKKMT